MLGYNTFLLAMLLGVVGVILAVGIPIAAGYLYETFIGHTGDSDY